jgi:hypothetical protein
MTVTDWLARVTADAESRGLAELVPLLQALARSTEALRDADGQFGHPAWGVESPAGANAAAEDDGDH